MQQLVRYRSLSFNYISSKVTSLNNFYVNLIGLNEVYASQRRVTEIQDKLLAVQETRRDLNEELANLRAKSNAIQEQLHKIKRQDDMQKFLDLMKEEIEIHRQESYKNDQFKNVDREERDLFTAFTDAIRDSHEKQRVQMEYSKYLGIGLSIFGAFLTFMYSTLRRDHLKMYLNELCENQTEIRNVVTNLNENTHTKIIQLQNDQIELKNILLQFAENNRNNKKINMDKVQEPTKAVIGVGKDSLPNISQPHQKYSSPIFTDNVILRNASETSKKVMYGALVLSTIYIISKTIF